MRESNIPAPQEMGKRPLAEVATPAATARAAGGGEKPPLGYEELRDIIDLSLWAGQLLLQDGASSERVEETVHHLGTGLGCNWMDIFVSTNVITITAVSGDDFRTKTRRVVNLGVNLNAVTALNDLGRHVSQGKMDRFEVRAELERIAQSGHQFNRWVIVFVVGLACAAFSRLFGADLVAFVATFIAASGAMILRQELAHRYFNPYLIVVVCAFVAGLLSSTAALLNATGTPEAAVYASVLLLVPGVPLINSVQDLIKGYTENGVSRGTVGLTISLAIAVGLILALGLLEVGLL